MLIAVTKIGENVLTATDPNDFIMRSDLNTFKIIIQGIKSVTLVGDTANQTFTQAHGLPFVPLVTGFAKQDGYSQVFAPNSFNIDIWGPFAGVISTGVVFNYIQADSTNIIFNFDNKKGIFDPPTSDADVDISYFCLEAI